MAPSPHTLQCGGPSLMPDLVTRSPSSTSGNHRLSQSRLDLSTRTTTPQRSALWTASSPEQSRCHATSRSPSAQRRSAAVPATVSARSPPIFSWSARAVTVDSSARYSDPLVPICCATRTCQSSSSRHPAPATRWLSTERSSDTTTATCEPPGQRSDWLHAAPRTAPASSLATSSARPTQAIAFHRSWASRGLPPVEFEGDERPTSASQVSNPGKRAPARGATHAAVARSRRPPR